MSSSVFLWPIPLIPIPVSLYRSENGKQNGEQNGSANGNINRQQNDVTFTIDNSYVQNEFALLQEKLKHSTSMDQKDGFSTTYHTSSNTNALHHTSDTTSQRQQTSVLTLERVQLGLLHPSLHAMFFIFETWNNNYPINQLKASQNEIKEILNEKHGEFWERRSIHTGAWLVWMKIMEDRLLLENGNQVDESINSGRNDVKLQYILPPVNKTSSMNNSNLHSLHNFDSDQNTQWGKLISDWSTQWWIPYKSPSEMLKLLRCITRNQSRISKREWNRMKIIFRGGRSLLEECSQLSELTPKHLWQNDYASIDDLAKFICVHLKWNEKLFPRVGGKPIKSTHHQDEKVWMKTFPTSQYLTICHLSQASCKYEAGAIRPFVRIFNCKSCIIYILHPIEVLMIEDCKACTIIVGAVRKIVNIFNCEAMRCTLATRCLQVNQSKKISINCCVNIPPVITDSCKHIIFGPHNTYYKSLAADLQTAGVNPRLNQFKDPFVIQDALYSCNGITISHSSVEDEKSRLMNEKSERVWSLLEPKYFTQFVIPFPEENDSTDGLKDKVNVCSIPTEYANALRDKMWSVAKLFDQMKRSIKTNPQMQSQLEEYISSEFKTWIEKDKVQWQECFPTNQYIIE